MSIYQVIKLVYYYYSQKIQSLSKDFKDIETIQITKSYAESYAYSKIVILNPAKLRELILTMNIYHEKQISNIAYEISEKVLNGKIK